MMSATQHLIFIDSELSDFSSIIENLPVGSTWFKIDGSSDGILEMESIAQNEIQDYLLSRFIMMERKIIFISSKIF